MSQPSTRAGGARTTSMRGELRAGTRARFGARARAGTGVGRWGRCRPRGSVCVELAVLAPVLRSRAAAWKGREDPVDALRRVETQAALPSGTQAAAGGARGRGGGCSWPSEAGLGRGRGSRGKRKWERRRERERRRQRRRRHPGRAGRGRGRRRGSGGGGDGGGGG